MKINSWSICSVLSLFNIWIYERNLCKKEILYFSLRGWKTDLFSHSSDWQITISNIHFDGQKLFSFIIIYLLLRKFECYFIHLGNARGLTCIEIILGFGMISAGRKASEHWSKGNIEAKIIPTQDRILTC